MATDPIPNGLTSLPSVDDYDRQPDEGEGLA
jgi:hypothetical protein